MTQDTKRLLDRDDTIKHVHTQMIHWHGPTGTVFSVDIQSLLPLNTKQRVATAGSDCRVQVWELRDNELGVGYAEHLAELYRHDCAVNTARFHPSENILASASDDRCLFIWKLDDSDCAGAPKIFSDGDDEDAVENRENWTVIKQIRGHSSEVYDIAWSPDGALLLAGTMDNASYVWDAGSCKMSALLQHHSGYVQGVAWDPKNKLLATLGTDRAAMIYNAENMEPLRRITKMQVVGKSSPEDKGRSLRVFLDPAMVDTFFRRPSFSPDGKLVAFPTGCYEVENEDATPDSADDKFLLINVVYIYNHNNFDRPALCLPSGDSPAIAVRFCPQLFALRDKNSSSGHKSIFQLPYRMLLAVVTLDNVLLYDTQQSIPFASIGNIHYEQLTDAAWSSDGKYLMVSSIDGFCTIITIDLEKLGEPYVKPVTPPRETISEGKEALEDCNGTNQPEIVALDAHTENCDSSNDISAVQVFACTGNRRGADGAVGGQLSAGAVDRQVSESSSMSSVSGDHLRTTECVPSKIGPLLGSEEGRASCGVSRVSDGEVPSATFTRPLSASDGLVSTSSQVISDVEHQRSPVEWHASVSDAGLPANQKQSTDSYCQTVQSCLIQNPSELAMHKTVQADNIEYMIID